MVNVSAIVKKLKENNEDHEFYPTTEKMIKKVFNDYTKGKKGYNERVNEFSMLDVGAGNGNVFDSFETCQRLEMNTTHSVPEKSMMLKHRLQMQ